MRFLQNLPIRSKLMVMTMLISCIALVVGCGSFAFYEQSVLRKTIARDIAMIADIFDNNLAGALTFLDASQLTRTLETLSPQSHILAACVYNDAGAVVASYQRPDLNGQFTFPAAKPTSQHFGDDRIDTYKDIEWLGDNIGSIYIGSDLRELHNRAWSYVYIVGALLVACSAMALLLTSRLQKIISDPILNLARTADAVAIGKDYSLRAVKQSDDEVGRLIDGFNHMLGQIQIQNVELEKGRTELEKRVEERTHQLQSEVEERKRVATALQTSDAFLNSLLETLPVCIYRKDKSGRFIFANALFCAAHGRPQNEILGLSDIDLSTPEQARKYSKDDQNVMTTRAPFEAVEPHRTPDGGQGWIQIQKVAVVDQGNEVIGTQGMFWDVTARKQAEIKVEQLHRELLDTSRRAGMAEVATGVLHNVGNVLNSVNVSANLAMDRMRESKLVQVPKIAAMLEEHAPDLGVFLTQDPKGRLIPGYLKALGGELQAEQSNVIEELGHLRTHIGHIKDIVAMQQNYAKVSGLAEAAPVTDLVDDALRMNASALTRHGLEVVRDYLAQPILTVERHKVVQILVNLIRNAKQACDDSGRTDKQLTVRISEQGNRVLIAVLDNGVGIPPENLTRIFAHGFTTRKEGHGFGLHHSALTAKELGGTLHAQSDGPGHGAKFTLELPIETQASPS